MDTNPSPTRWSLGLAAMILLAGCAGPAQTLRVGMPAQALPASLGTPTARYAMADAERLEYATGPYGRQTWMIDVDGQGRVLRWQQVLDESNLMALQGKLPGMTSDQLLRTLGRPGNMRGGAWAGGQVWSWRYETHLCLWFQVSVGEDGIVRDGAFLPDPLCDGRDDDRSAFNMIGRRPW